MAVGTAKGKAKLGEPPEDETDLERKESDLRQYILKALPTARAMKQGNAADLLKAWEFQKRYETAKAGSLTIVQRWQALARQTGRPSRIEDIRPAG